MSLPTGDSARFASLGGLLALAVVVAVLPSSLAPPRPQPASAPPETFSAERAMRHVEWLAAAPRPVGSPAHAAARDELRRRLEELGIEAETQASIGLWSRGSRVLAARVENVVARIPGTASTGAVLLMAHYDSRSLTPGAGDDASGVAALLETARALSREAALRNDLILLFSDGEELALLGAQVFAEEHRWAGEVAAVFNFEARGNAGRALMFETGPANLREVRWLRRFPHPVASSLSSEVYRRMPNDTDFTVFRRRGLPGMNFAFIGGHPAYHSMLDTPERLAGGSLQQLGESALAAARTYGGIDLAQQGSSDAVYFNPMGNCLVVYPARWGVWLAAIAGLAVLMALAWGKSAGRWTWSGLAAALGLHFGLLGAAGIAGYLAWWLLETFAAGRLETPHALPYASRTLSLALGALILALVAAAAARWRRSVSGLELVAATAVLWALGAVLGSIFVPGAAYLFLWPGLMTSAVLLAAIATGAAGRRWVEPVGWTLAAAVTVLLWLPTALLVSEALSLRLAPVVAVVAVVAWWPFLPLLRAALPSGESAGKLAGALAVVALATGIAAVALSPASVERPRVDSLLYLEGPEEGEAGWWSFDESLDEWTQQVMGAAARPAEAEFGSTAGVRWRAEARALGLAPPVLEVLNEQRGERQERTLELLLSSPRGAPIVRLDASSSVPLRVVSVEGRGVETSSGSDDFHFVAYNVGAEGIRITVRVEGRWPVEGTVSDQSYGLPATLGLPARPPHVISDLRWQAESTWGARRVLF